MSERSSYFQAAAVVAFVGIPSLGFTLVSGAFNSHYAAQLGQTPYESYVWVLASVMVTLSVCGLPLAIEILRDRNAQLAMAARMLWIAAVLFSVISAMGFASLTRGETTARADAVLKDRQSLERAIARVERELNALGAYRATDAITADLERAETIAGYDCLDIRSRRERQACAPVFQLRTEYAAAQSAVRLEARLASLHGQLNGLAVVGNNANPQASILAWIGRGVLSPDTWERLLTVFVAVLIELGASLGMAITARSVAILLETPGKEEEQPVETATPFVPGEGENLRVVDPETGWRLWFERCVQPAKDGRVKAADAFAHYQNWAAVNGIDGTIKQFAFYGKMRDCIESVGARIIKNNTTFYDGVTLADIGANGAPLDEAGE